MYGHGNIFPRVSSEDARRTTLLKEWCMCVWVQAAGHGDRGPQVAQLRGRNSNCVFQGCASPLRSASPDTRRAVFGMLETWQSLLLPPMRPLAYVREGSGPWANCGQRQAAEACGWQILQRSLLS